MWKLLFDRYLCKRRDFYIPYSKYIIFFTRVSVTGYQKTKKRLLRGNNINLLGRNVLKVIIKRMFFMIIGMKRMKMEKKMQQDLKEKYNDFR